MENVVAEFISQWGPLGILAILAGYIVFERIKAAVSDKSDKEKNQQVMCTNHLNENGLILKLIEGFKDNMDKQLDNIDKRMGNLDRSLIDVKQTFNTRHELITKRLVNLEDRIKNQPKEVVDNVIEYELNKWDEHNRKLLEHVELGPVIHRILGRYLQIVNCDHILLGAFHNGSSTLNGIPYCKFDIIAEKYDAKENIHDTDFSSIYKNVDLMLHNKLPSVLIQNTYAYFEITQEEGKCLLDDLDDLLYRRALGRGVKQIAFHLLRDINNIPIGFLCCLKFDDDKMVEREIQNCSRELEEVYNSQTSINKR